MSEKKKKVPANHDLHNAACSYSYSDGGCIISSCHWFDLFSWPKVGMGSTKYSSCNGLLIYLIVEDNISVYIYSLSLISKYALSFYFSWIVCSLLVIWHSHAFYMVFVKVILTTNGYFPAKIHQACFWSKESWLSLICDVGSAHHWPHIPYLQHPFLNPDWLNS